MYVFGQYVQVFVCVCVCVCVCVVCVCVLPSNFFKLPEWTRDSRVTGFINVHVSVFHLHQMSSDSLTLQCLVCLMAG